MDIAEFGLGLVRRALKGGRVGNIHFDRAGANVEGGKLAARDLELPPFDVGEHDVDAAARQRPANAEADSVGGTGDEGGLAGELHYISPDRTASGRDCSEVSSARASKPCIINSKRRWTSVRRSACVKT